MAFLKSAFESVVGNNNNSDNEFVGSFVELGKNRLFVNRLIAEGKTSMIILII